MESTCSKHCITGKLLFLSTVSFNLDPFRHMILNPDDETVLKFSQNSAQPRKLYELSVCAPQLPLSPTIKVITTIHWDIRLHNPPPPPPAPIGANMAFRTHLIYPEKRLPYVHRQNGDGYCVTDVVEFCCP
jgi:hypothetical protein